MAKRSMIQRELKREKLIKRFATKRATLKQLSVMLILPMKHVLKQLASLPRYHVIRAHRVIESVVRSRGGHMVYIGNLGLPETNFAKRL